MIKKIPALLPGVVLALGIAVIAKLAEILEAKGAPKVVVADQCRTSPDRRVCHRPFHWHGSQCILETNSDYCSWN